MSSHGLKRTTLSHVRVEMEVEVAAPQAVVWKSLLHEMGEWWRKDFYSGQGSVRFRAEPHVGGRVFEEDDHGNGLLWYHVAMIAAPNILHLTGHLSPPWGGPATSQIRIELLEKAGRTHVLLTDNLFGVLDDKAYSSMLEGWTLLLGSLKEYVESRPR